MGKVCSIDPLIVEEDRARVVDVVKQALSEDKPFEVEYRIRHKIGAIRHLREYGRPIKSLTGEHSYIDGVIFDDTERKQAEEALRTSEERFRKMFERHSAAMFLIEPETGRIIDANKAAERFYGYAASQLLSMSIQDINALPPDDVEAQRNLAVQERRNHFIFPHRLASGEVRTVEVHSSPIEQNGALLLFAIIHDITDRKRLEEERLEMERKVLHAQKLESLNVMAGGIAHDFNNQLAVVLGNLELALTDRTLNPKGATQHRERCRGGQTISGTLPPDADLHGQYLALSCRLGSQRVVEQKPQPTKIVCFQKCHPQPGNLQYTSTHSGRSGSNTTFSPEYSGQLLRGYL